MTKQIHDFYNQIAVSDDITERMIKTSKTAKPHRTINKIAVIAAASAAVLIIGLFSLLIFRSLQPHYTSGQTVPSYDTVLKIGNVGTGDDALIAHDGLAVAIESAYSNGKTVYVALFGEYIQNDIATDTLQYSFSEGGGAVFTVNGKAAKLNTKDIVLKKSGKLFKGVISLEIDEPASAARLDMIIPAFDIYSDTSLIKTVSGPFELEGGIIRAYTDNESALLNGDNVLYIQSIVQNPRDTVGDYVCGIEIQYSVPYEMINSGKDIQAKVFNEDGSEILMSNSLEYADLSGNRKNMLRSFDFPDSRNIKVMLYDANDNNKTIQEYDVVLNDLDWPLAFDD